jgi:hypothetical protein
MSNRVINRRGARDLTPEEMERTVGAGTDCLMTICNVRVIDDLKCGD